MPWQPQAWEQPRESTSSSSVTGSNALPQATQPVDSAMLTSSVHTGQSGPQELHMTRPTLPSLSYLQAGSQFPQSPLSPAAASYGASGSYVAPSQYIFPSTSQTYSSSGPGEGFPGQLTLRGDEPVFHSRLPQTESGQVPPSRGPSYNPLKRPHGTSESAFERSHHDTLPYSVTTGDMSEYRGFPPSGSVSNVSTPTTTGHPVPSHNAAYSSTRSTSSASASRFKLHFRQQPRAARAGPDGKDRRPIDPPPVLQLLMTDFNINNAAEVEELHSSYWVAHCRLVSANSPRRDMSTLASRTEDGSKEIQRLLLGTSVASPFQTKDDPDPETMPLHPLSADTEPSGPPSPSSRFLPSSRAPPPTYPYTRAGSVPNTPSTFFIFADISVRKAGEYRLEFSLMHMDPASLSVPGYNVPILCTIASQVFRVVNAKDFDQVKKSSSLVRGLVERGAGFPLKLKKGNRERGGLRGESGSEDDDDDDD